MNTERPMVWMRGSLAEEHEWQAAARYFPKARRMLTGIGQGDLVVARYSVLPFYPEVEEEVRALGGRLLNTYEQHLFAAKARRYAAVLAEHTPEVWSLEEALAGPALHDGYVVKGETNYIRKVATKVSNTEITVDTAVDLTAGYSGWFFYPWRIGTADTDGWHAIQGYPLVTVWVEIPTVAAAGGVTISIQTMSPNIGGTPVEVFTKNYAAAAEEPINIGEVAGALRVGVKGGSGFAGTDEITIYMTGGSRKVGY